MRGFISNLVLPMMNGFQAKLMLVIAALVLLLLMGDFQATCALLPHAEADQGGDVDCRREGLRKINIGRKEEGRGRSSLWRVDCRDGLALAKIHIGRKQGSFGCQGENFSKKIMPTRRSLRPITGQKPPSPTKNGRKSQFVPLFPPGQPRRPHPPPPPSSNDPYSPGS